MKKLRWVMDGGFWDLDASTPLTIDGTARAVPGDPLPLGVSRGVMLSRPRQLDFMQRFMALISVPSYGGSPLKGGDGFSLERAISLPIGENWFTSLLGRFHLQRFVSSTKGSTSESPKESSWSKKMGTCLCDRSLFALGLWSEFLIAPDLSLLLGSEAHGGREGLRNKAILRQRLPDHNLTVEAVSPCLFVDKDGNFWDVPLLLGVDLSSVASTSGFSHHLCVQHCTGSPKRFDGDQNNEDIPEALCPGLSVKSAFSVRKDASVWRSKEGKLRMVQPFDVFLSDPHISVSGLIGAAVNASFGDNVERPSDENQRLFLRVQRNGSALAADFFGSISCTAQHGNFQRLFFDLTRLHARLDFPSGCKFLSGAAHVTQNLYNSQQPNSDSICSICPKITISLQQQIAGPVSFRVESRVGLAVDEQNSYVARVDDSVFAIEYALKVLGSAKAVAWYSPKQGEGMVELRFFES